MNKTARIHQYGNGLVLVAEEMPWCESVSFVILTPSGVIHDPSTLPGLADLTCELMSRGAGKRDNREFLQALENLGVESSEGVSQPYANHCASLLADKLTPALDLYADLILRPALQEEELPQAQQVILQELMSIEDDPDRKLMIRLRKNFYPDPWGRPVHGTAEAIESISVDDIRDFHRKTSLPNGSIISIAGRIDWENVKEQVGRLFGDWQENDLIEPEENDPRILCDHLPLDSEQTHIGIAWPSLPFGDPNHLYLLSAVRVLSGGMSSRLFTEVREKRGLCYSVSAVHQTHGKRGAVFCYCGTRSSRAQESLDVILEEIDKLYSRGINQDELEILKIRNKCSLVMQQESTGNRAASIAYDWYHLHRIRSMQEIEQSIDNLTIGAINDCLIQHRAENMRLVSLGPDELKIDPARLG